MKTGSQFRSRRFGAIAAVLFCIAAMLVLGFAAGAGNAAQAGKAPLRSASEIDYPPFCIVDADGRAGGFSVELMRVALAAMGREVTFRTGPWGKVRGWLERGEVQALPLVGRTPEREDLFDFTFPYMSIHGAIVVRENTRDIHDLSDLKGRRVAVMKGDNAEEFLRREDRGIEIHTAATFDEALRELSKGRYDAVVIQRLVALRLIQEAGLTTLRIVNKPIEGFRQDFCFAVREGDRETLALLNEGLALVMADGTYRHLHAKWFAALQLPSNRHIIVGGDHNFPPYEYLDEKGRPAGYNVELTRAIAREMGLDIEIRLGPWAEVREALARGEIDALQGMFYSPERDLQFDFSQAHILNHCVSVVRRGEGDPPATVGELVDRRIVVQRGDIMHDFVLESGLGKEVAVVGTQENALRELAEGKHDCALVSRVTALYCIKKEGWTNLVVGRKPLISTEYCYAVPNNHRALLAQFSEGLKVLEENGEYRRIYEKWMGMYREKTLSFISVLRYVAMVVVPLILILLAVSLWSWSLRRQVASRTAELAAVSQRHLAILAAVPDIIMEVDPGKIYTWANRAGFDFFGDDVIGREAAYYFVGEQDTYDTVQPLFDGDENVHYIESWQRRKDGQERLLAWWSRVLKDTSGTVSGVLATARDITELKRAEEVLRENEEKYRFLTEKMQDIVWMADMDLRTTYVSPSVRVVLGFSQEERMRMSIDEQLTPDSLSLGLDALAQEFALEEEKADPDRSATLVLEYYHKDGSTRWMETIMSGVRDEQGVLTGLHGVSRDITDRKKAEEALRESEKKYRELIDGMNETVWVIDFNGTLIDVNNTAVELLGYSKEELLEIGLYGIDSKLKKDDIKALAAAMQSDQRQIFETSHTTKDGRTFPVEVYSSLVTYQGKPAILSIARDITDRKQAEEELRESEERYRMIVERMSDIVWMTDMNLRTTFVTPSLQMILGFTPEERVLQPIEEQMTPDSLSYASNLLAEELADEEGGEVDPDRTKTVELEYYHKDGSTRWMETTVAGIRDDQGVLTGLLGVFRDITDRRQAAEQLQRTLERLRESVGITIQAMVSAVEIRDPYTAGHQSRSADLARAIATEMELPEEKVEAIRMAGSIHDIGKLSVPAEILSKPTQLSANEFALIKEHPRSGYEILKNVETDWPLAEIIYQHHERMDGSGYPRGLKGDEIIMEARIMAVADVVESMASHRPYRAALGIEASLEEIEENRKILYDDAVADACLRLFREKGYQLP